AKHARVHLPLLRRKEERRKAKTAKDVDARNYCPHCNLRFESQSALIAHARAEHGKRKKPKKNTHTPTTNKKKVNGKPGHVSKRSQRIPDIEHQRQLDATKGYAHFARENGRFGSHPSHDDFGDESRP